MMRKLISRSILLLSAAVLCSCAGKQQTGKTSIPFVREVISNTSSVEHRKVADYTPAKSGAIYIIGSEDYVSALRQELLECDRFDNVDASSKPDGLKDFSGETIGSVFDLLYTPYSQYSSDSQVREICIKDILSTMDTVCYVGAFDKTGVGTKPCAKLAVLASPYFSEYGHFDADTLFSALNCSMPVISPLNVMIDEALENTGKDAMIGVIAPSESIPIAGYTALVQEKAKDLGLESAECVVFPSDSSETNPLVSFLDKYIAAGYTHQLEAIIIDDLDIDASAFNDELEVMLSGVNAETGAYSNLLAKGFKILDIRSAVSTKCFRTLREMNLFTHNISKAKAADYQTLLNDENSVVLTQYSPVQ